ncbi:hypothetical protein IR120_10400 [Muribacter muris]|uniref:hypothetical protein n=1 Tax=Muribacter muris TaxID=67855 RepID=UPI0018847E17|nr:hypothetical protein [Muribacter muris]MBF0785869.1 hypothetical protein [Muribacter muris]MBF0827217.1 hypothetical protein [Muribacter muris]
MQKRQAKSDEIITTFQQQAGGFDQKFAILCRKHTEIAIESSVGTSLRIYRFLKQGDF